MEIKLHNELSSPSQPSSFVTLSTLCCIPLTIMIVSCFMAADYKECCISDQWPPHYRRRWSCSERLPVPQVKVMLCVCTSTLLSSQIKTSCKLKWWANRGVCSMGPCSALVTRDFLLKRFLAFVTKVERGLMLHVSCLLIINLQLVLIWLESRVEVQTLSMTFTSGTGRRSEQDLLLRLCVITALHG